MLRSAGALAVVGLTAWLGLMAADRASRPTELAPVVHGHRLDHRWIYVQNNFQAEGNVERVTEILERGAAAGFNGVIFADGKFGRLDDGSLIDAYYTNLRAVLQRAKALGLSARPATADFGYSDSILWHDPNLAEALPVRDAPFRPVDDTLVPVNDPPTAIVNGSFDDLPANGHSFPGWAWQDAPGVATFVDTSVVHGGRASLRMENLGQTNAPHGNGRVHQRLTVRPFQNYHVSVWVRTEDFRGGDVRVLVLGEDPSRTLQWNSVPVTETQDWTRFDTTFNSLENAEVLFYFGVWGGDRGTIWWDSGQIEPAGLVNLVRRPGAPVRIASPDGGVVYEEGRDVEPLEDPIMGSVPWPGSYDPWHPPPEIRLPADSPLRQVDRVHLSYYHTTTVYSWQVSASLTEPAVFDIVGQQMASLQREFEAAEMFSGWHFSHDEIRLHGWDAAPDFGNGSPGDNLAGNIARIHADARGLAPGAQLSIWSDMFDPHHNAADLDTPYYLVNGDWSGSWVGLPADVLILNWNRGGERRASAEFFSHRGHEQVLAGYYDAAPGRFSDRQWLADLEGVPEVTGVMYTQWGSGYANLEAWADHVWGDAEWVEPGGMGTPAATDTAAPQTPTPQASHRLFLPYGLMR